MNSSWYCQDCDRQIDTDERDQHEAGGHEVRGVLRPDRLLGTDPWNLEVRNSGAGQEDPEVVGD
ncbi:MAG: hypothetical protein V5A18_00120 [Haloarculaceae archaeon]